MQVISPSNTPVKRLLAAISIFSATALTAAEYTWTGAAHDGNYLNSLNWLDNTFPAATDTETIIILSEQGAGTITLGPLIVRLRKLVFENTAAPYVFQGNGIVFQLGEGIEQTGAGEVRLDNLTIETLNNATFKINGAITLNGQLRTSDGQVITKAGAGSIDITAGQPDFNGTLNLDGGTIRLSANPGGAGQFILSSGNLAIAGGLNITNRINLPNTDGTPHNIDITGNATLSGPIALNGDSTLNVNGPGRLTLAGAVATETQTTESRFVIRGNSLVILSGANNLAGNLRVETGNIVLNSPNALHAPGAPASTTKIKLAAAGYAGYTQSFATTFAEFLANIRAINDPNAIVGIDSVNPAATRTVSDDINLSYIDGQQQTGPYYLGTSSRIKLTGNITPTFQTNTAGATVYDALHLTAIHDGYLNVASQLGGTVSQVNTVVIGRAPDAGNTPPGTVELSGNNTYAGGTKILGGTLQINAGNNLGAGDVTVSAGATLNLGTSGTVMPHVSLETGSTISGNGTFDKLVNVGYGVNLVPGAIGKIAEMHLHGGILIMPGAIWHVDISTLASDKLCVWDKIAINGDPLIPITINLRSINADGTEGALASFDPAQPHTWTIAYRPATTGLVVTGFAPSYFAINTDAFFEKNPGLRGLGDFNIEQIGASLALTFTPVPEPGAYALMTLGLGALALIRWRRRQRS